MTNRKQNLISLAVLSATVTAPVGVASLSLEFEVTDGWCQLLPAGHFRAVDGRPHDVESGQWFINQNIAERLIAGVVRRTNDLVIDYEHQTLNALSNGVPAPAAGWITDLEWREGSGLWIQPKWTDKAKAFIKNDEYRFLSAVFSYNTDTGEPIELHSAGLTNVPGIDGMASVEALSLLKQTSQQEIPAMNEELRKLLAKLGIELGENDEISDDQAEAALTALVDLETRAGESDKLKKQVATLTSQAKSGVDLTQWVPVATYNALAGEMAVLKADGDKNTVKSLVDDAQEEGRILAAEVEYYTQLGEENGSAALTKALESRVPIAALATQQTKDKDDPSKKKKGMASLTKEELRVCEQMGISPEDYMKNKGEA